MNAGGYHRPLRAPLLRLVSLFRQSTTARHRRAAPFKYGEQRSHLAYALRRIMDAMMLCVATASSSLLPLPRAVCLGPEPQREFLATTWPSAPRHYHAAHLHPMALPESPGQSKSKPCLGILACLLSWLAVSRHTTRLCPSPISTAGRQQRRQEGVTLTTSRASPPQGCHGFPENASYPRQRWPRGE